jgi:hypothetical protein
MRRKGKWEREEHKKERRNEKEGTIRKREAQDGEEEWEGRENENWRSTRKINPFGYSGRKWSLFKKSGRGDSALIVVHLCTEDISVFLIAAAQQSVPLRLPVRDSNLGPALRYGR